MIKARTRGMFFTMVIVATLMGCGVVGDARDESGTRESAREESNVAGDAPSLPEPPGSTLSYGGETVKAGLGSYCWSSGSAGGCADAIGISLGRETLRVPADAALEFEYGGKDLDSLSVSAEKIGQGNRLEKIDDEDVLISESGKGHEQTRLRTLRSGNRACIIAGLTEGEYAISAFARMPEGDASYGFRVVIEGDGDLPATGGSQFPDGLR